MIRLAFLAPAIVERIAEGRQPPELTAQFLSTGRGDLPLSWHAQEKLLGFADPASATTTSGQDVQTFRNQAASIRANTAGFPSVGQLRVGTSAAWAM